METEKLFNKISAHNMPKKDSFGFLLLHKCTYCAGNLHLMYVAFKWN